MPKDYTNKIDEKVYEFGEIEKNLKKFLIKIKDGISSTVLNSECESDTKVAIIIPHRNRLANLKIYLNNMHPLLTRQKINYGIYVVEPVKDIEFNRALLFNIGFLESIKHQNRFNFTWDCFIFHGYFSL